MTAAPVVPSRRPIRVLPSALADQIAAGEVVERPASVVKELVENALDACARRIDVEIEGGGRRLVRVVDDGWGLPPDDARLALRRHATSKLSMADDLWALSTFGFRGEALPSIAAVSRLTLLSRPREALDGGGAGFRLVVEAGVETDAREAGVPAGTQVEVRDLFFNTPARAKFLKSESTEEANIYEAVLRLGIAHPDVHLRLRVKGAVRLDLPPHRDLAERVRAALARRGAGALHEAMGEEGGYRVRAFLADPDAATTTARNTYLFVGGRGDRDRVSGRGDRDRVSGRAVRDRSLLHAVAQAYGPLLEKGRYPLAALFLEVPGGELDVNVHPQKLEVRFARPQEVYAAVRHVLGAALARAPWLEGAGATAARGQPLRTFTLPPGLGERPAGGAGSWTQVASTQAALLLRAGDAAPNDSVAGDVRGGAPPAGVARAGDGAARSLGVVDSAMPFFAGLNYIGQLHRTYLVCESQGELILVDQHAAHERIAYGRLVAAHGRREVRRQRLLFPLPIEVDEAAAAVVEGAGQATLDALGFEVERTGARAVRVRAVPEMLKDADPKPLLRDVLGQLAEGVPTAETLEGIDHVLATMACHSVVRAGDVLGRSEAVGLLAQLDGVDLRSHCPHGRPILLRLPLGEIERRLGRV
ncbi:MAG TPA: DNA mismatch repair endonuclease MutL [Polyangia bacterium]|nr:DNA mismatch repair endonuclease MutL [Polyangia bacterium]